MAPPIGSSEPKAPPSTAETVPNEMGGVTSPAQGVILWRPMPGPAPAVFSILALAILCISGILGLRLWAIPPGVGIATVSMTMGLGLAVAAGFFYRSACYKGLVYSLDDQALHIRWGLRRYTVPLGTILSIHPPHPQAVRYQTPYLPTDWTGPGYIPDGGPALFFSTRPPTECLLITVDTSRRGADGPAPAPILIIGVSPAEMEAFRLALLDAARSAEPSTSPMTVWEPTWAAIWQDGPMRFLAALALVLNLTLYVYIWWWFPALPASLPIHYDALGNVDRFGPAQGILWLPLIGSFVLTGNALLSSLLAQDRLLAIVLMGATPWIQVLLWVAVLRIVPGL